MTTTRPGRARRALVIALLGIAGLLAGAAGTLYALSARRLSARYPYPSARIVAATDSASVARGAHIARAISSCVLCHGADLGGATYADEGPLGVIAGPNLTRGRGGVPGGRSDEELVRAIRYGVRHDSTSLIVMPSEVFALLSDEDLAALLGFIRQLPPVDREPPPTRFGPLGRALLAMGKLDILVAPKTPRPVSVPAVPRGVTVEYGRYLADIGGCHGCHGFGLSGGRVAGPPDVPLASNLTPDGATGIGEWSEADFARALREGRRPDGRQLDEFMPWRVFSGMTDDEVRALWLYLRSVPAKPFGGK
jgi:mono/diheme cytochrome c family protein